MDPIVFEKICMKQIWRVVYHCGLQIGFDPFPMSIEYKKSS